MDVQSVAHTLGTCFAEFVRERVEDHGGHADEGKLIAQISRQYRIPAEYGSRMMGYAAKNGAVEVKELADGGATVSNVAGYAESSSANDSSAAAVAEDRGDYPVAYGLDTRPATPAVLFPESTNDYVSGGADETTSEADLYLSGAIFHREALKGRILDSLGSEPASHGDTMRRVFPKMASDLEDGESINEKRARAIKSGYSIAMNALIAEGRVKLADGGGAYRLPDTSDSLTGSAEIDRDLIGKWRKDYHKRTRQNATIIEASGKPERVDYGADILDTDTRDKIEAESSANTYYFTRSHRQQHGCINCQQADARSEWAETDRLINWLYQRGGKYQQIEALYYERGAHTEAARRPIREALDKLCKLGKARRIRRGGRVYVQLANSVEARAYTVADYSNRGGEDHCGGEDSGEDQPQEQSFEPAVIAEMAASGASYKEAWDS